MRIDFEEKDHIYAIDGEIASISVTELLAKHGLAADYSGAKKSTLRAKADKGKEIHKDLENVLNTANYTPKTAYGEAFAKWVKANLDCGAAEFKLGYEYEGLKIAGTADVIGFTKGGFGIIADHKSTSRFYREAVTWQVNLLDFFARKLDGQSINGREWHWKGAVKFYCFHYADDEMKVYELDKIPDSEIMRLIECEYNGEIYKRPALVIDGELKDKVIAAEKYLAHIESVYKQAEAAAKEIRAQMCKAMEGQGVLSWETDGIKISYVAGYDRITVDSAKLKKDFPEVWEKCNKLTSVKSTVRITIKGDKDDD